MIGGECVGRVQYYHYCDIALRVAFSGRLRLNHTTVWGAGRIKEYGHDEAYFLLPLSIELLIIQRKMYTLYTR